jgi:hypothetical protein
VAGKVFSTGVEGEEDDEEDEEDEEHEMGDAGDTGDGGRFDMAFTRPTRSHASPNGATLQF